MKDRSERNCLAARYAREVRSATSYWLIHKDFAVPDLDVEPTIGIGANPGLEIDRGTLAAEIGERHQIASTALLTFRQNDIHPPNPSHPAVFEVAYRHWAA